MTKRGLLMLTALGAVALILGLSSGGNAPAAVTTLYADVGPGYTITLKDAAGAAVTKLTPGTYAIVVNDQAADHNFHLTGPGGVDLSTTVPFVGQETWTVDLVAGSYRFVCDPHADGMFGGFTVAQADTTALYAEVGPGYTITLKDGAGTAVTNLTPGAYTIVVNDQAPDHNFHLTGAGGVDLSTTVPFVGQETWTVDLVAGSYRFVCDPHADGMFGDFTVAEADTTPPDTSISTGPSGSVNSTSASFSFSSSEAGSTFECALDTAAFAVCTSPKTYSALANGPHTFEVRATDAAGNVDPSSARRAWTIDTVPPDTTITSGPSGTVGSTSATFNFSSNETGASFQCALDSTTAYSACTSPKTYSGLAGGTHVFRVRAVDAASNVDATPAGRSWTIATPPETTITAAPTGVVASGDAIVEFTSSKAGSSFECALDAEVFAVCSSPQVYSGLGDGDHTFEVRAIDSFGNVDATPASAAWTIDTTPPETTIDAGPSGSVNAADASFSFSASELGSSFECSLDGGAYEACNSPQSYAGLAEGVHSFEVRATDAAGNLDTTPAGVSWTIDTAAPDTTIDSGPAGTVGQTTATFALSSSEPDSSFECALDGAAFGACSSPASYSGLAEGPHTFQVRATDAAGNTDATAASSTWTINSTALYATVGPGFTISLTDAAGAPVTELAEGTHTIVVHDESAIHNFHLAGPGVDLTTTVPFVGEVIWAVTVTAGTYHYQCDPHVGMSGDFTVPDTAPPDTTITAGPAGTVSSTSADFEFSASEPGLSFECSLDGEAFAACSSPQSYSGLADGAHTFEVRATDAAGNADTSPASRGWAIDTAAPETSIDSGPSGTVDLDSASFEFSSSETGARFTCSLDETSLSDCTSPKSFTELAAGPHTFAVQAIDAVGNADPTPASRSWTIEIADTVPPETTIDSGPAALVASSSAGLSFSAGEAGASFECALDGTPFAACSSPATYSSLADGDHTFQVRATDAAGNTDPTPATRSWTVDTVAPDTSITVGPSGTVDSASASFEFSADEAGARFECALDGAAFSACSSPESYSELGDGSHTFLVRSVDAVGNEDATPAEGAWTVVLTAPAPATLAGEHERLRGTFMVGAVNKDNDDGEEDD
jgi:plastocyanin